MAKPLQVRWWTDPRQWLRAILMLDDTPHNIALGAAMGVFVALTPTVGFQMLLVLMIWALAWPFFRFNKVAGLLAVYLSNPFTVVPIYWFNYTLGALYFPSTITKEEFAALFQYDGLREWWLSLTHLFVDVGVPLLLGSAIVASVGGLITYPLTLRLLERLRHVRHKEHDRPTGGTVKQTVKQQPVRV